MYALCQQHLAIRHALYATVPKEQAHEVLCWPAYSRLHTTQASRFHMAFSTPVVDACLSEQC